MPHNDACRSIARCLFGACIGLVAVTAATADCKAPQYRRVSDNVDPQTGKGGWNISVRRDEFTVDKLLCLAETLKHQHQEWKDVATLFFSSDEAAERFDPGGMNDFPLTIDSAGRLLPTEYVDRFRRDLRAIHVLNIEKHENYLVITPLGLKSGEPYTTRIELPVTRKVHCRLELSNRCVLALEPIQFRDDALRARVSGTVTLTGQIRRDGTVTDIQVAAANSTSAEGKAQLMTGAVDNLKTWWVEPAPHEDRFRLTYSYVIDSSLQRRQLNVQFALPNQITIRANPPE